MERITVDVLKRLLSSAGGERVYRLWHFRDSWIVRVDNTSPLECDLIRISPESPPVRIKDFFEAPEEIL
jgi:hypothetical protein